MTNHRDGRPEHTLHRTRYSVETSWGKRIILNVTDDEAALIAFQQLTSTLPCNKGLKKTLVRDVRTVLAEGKL